MFYLLCVMVMFLILPFAVRAHKWWQKVPLLILTAGVVCVLGWSP